MTKTPTDSLLDPAKVSVPAIERADLRPILEKYQLLAAFEEGTLLCASCSGPLRQETIGALLVKQGQLIPYCNLTDCIEEAMEHKRI